MYQFLQGKLLQETTHSLLGARVASTEWMLKVVHGCWWWLVVWSLGFGLLLTLNDKLVSRIQLANMNLKAKKRHTSRTMGLHKL